MTASTLATPSLILAGEAVAALAFLAEVAFPFYKLKMRPQWQRSPTKQHAASGHKKILLNDI